MFLSVFLSLCVIFIAGCATQPPPVQDGPGFWVGLWHGMSAPVSFVVSIFKDIRFYQSPNGGIWYDVGFLLGLSFWGGGGAAACRNR